MEGVLTSQEGTIFTKDNGIMGTLNGSRPVDKCQSLDYKYDIAPAVICATCFLLGLIYTFIGYRLFKIIMFLTGFIIGTVISYVILDMYSTWVEAGNAGLAVGIGVLCGAITLFLTPLGIFLSGFEFGLLTATAVLIALEQFYHPSSKWIALGIMACLSLLCGGLALKFQKTFVILGTSLLGAALTMTSVDYYAEMFLMSTYVLERLKVVQSHPVCWFSWVILGCWPLLCIVGCLVQFLVTANKFNHKTENKRPTKKNQTVDLERMRARERHHRKHSRYRHLYRIRRSTGDVISKNYIQGVQDKLSPALRNFTNMQGITETNSTNTTLTQVDTGPRITIISELGGELGQTVIDNDEQ